MTVKDIRGPEVPPDLALQLPSCVKILTQKDEREFADFIAKIIEAAQRAASGAR